MKTSRTNSGERDADLAVRLGLKTVTTMDAAKILVGQLAERKLHLTTVESCTGGALANFVTSISGASSVLKDFFGTYSNEAKIELGVPEAIIEEHTVYSTQTAIAMAKAGLQRSVRADVGIGITGSLSRPDPENSNSIPGEVYIGVVFGDEIRARSLIISEEDRMEAKLHIVQRSIDEIGLILAQG